MINRKHKTSVSPKADIINKMQKFEEHLKKMRQQLENNEVTSDNYFAIQNSALLIDTLVWQYLKKPHKKDEKQCSSTCMDS